MGSMKLPFWPWAGLAAAAVCAPLLLLSGCAELMVVSGVTGMVKALPSNEPGWVETNRQTFADPVADVYDLLAQQVQRNGRTLVERDAQAHSVVISYPFSWLSNNWGGSIRVTCTPGESGTTVTIVGDGRDAVARVRAIGDEVLEDLGKALRQRPRTL